MRDISKAIESTNQDLHYYFVLFSFIVSVFCFQFSITFGNDSPLRRISPLTSPEFFRLASTSRRVDLPAPEAPINAIIWKEYIKVRKAGQRRMRYVGRTIGKVIDRRWRFRWLPLRIVNLLIHSAKGSSLSLAFECTSIIASSWCREVWATAACSLAPYPEYKNKFVVQNTGTPKTPNRWYHDWVSQVLPSKMEWYCNASS